MASLPQAMPVLTAIWLATLLPARGVLASSASASSPVDNSTAPIGNSTTVDDSTDDATGNSTGSSTDDGPARVDRIFAGTVLSGVPDFYDVNGSLRNGKKPLRLLTQRPESGGVGDAMGKVITVFNLTLQAVNRGNLLPDYVVELYLADSRCEPQVAVQATLKLLNRYPPGFFHGIFGPLCSDPAGAVNDIVQAYNLFQVASISRSPALSDGVRYPYLCRLSPPLQFVADGIVKLMQLFGWRRIALVQDHRSLSAATITQVYLKLKMARDAYEAGNASGYAFDIKYTDLNRMMVEKSTTDERAVVNDIKANKVRILVGALYEDAGLRFFCELYKQGYYGKKMQFILATGWWADNWIEEQVAEQRGSTLQQSGGGCTMQQVFTAAKHMASVAQTAWFQSPGKSHEVTQVDFTLLKQGYLNSCSDPRNEGCHNDFAAADYDGLSTVANTMHQWLYGHGGSLDYITYDNETPVRELYDIALQTDFLGVTGQVQFYGTPDLACERKGSFTVKQYSHLPVATGEDGWIVQTSFTNAGGFGELQRWTPFQWQDGTSTYFGSGVGFVPVAVGQVASFGDDTEGMEHVLVDWKECLAGYTVDAEGRACIKCQAGSFGEGGECIPCRRGTYASNDGMEICLNCPKGRFVNETGATNCTECQAGTISDPEAPWQCKECPVGRASRTDGQDECMACPDGQYQDLPGSRDCKSCAEELNDPALWTTGTGSSQMQECVCNAKYYRVPLIYTIGSKCMECPAGMECPMSGSSVEALEARARRGDTPVSEAGLHGTLLTRWPKLRPGYMSKVDAPLQVYLCLNEEACPGGDPGVCGKHRNTTQYACARCQDGAYLTAEGLCEVCSGGATWLVFAAVGVGTLAALALMTFVVNRDLLAQRGSITSVVIMGGILFVGLQTLGVYNNLSLLFFEPLKTILSSMTVLSFNLDMLKLGCMFPFNPVSEYIMRQLVPWCGIVCLFCICLFKKRCVRPTMDLCTEYINTVGTIFSALFLSITMSTMMPLICYRHPGDSGSSVRATPSILCFEDSRHGTMVTAGILSFLILIVPFLSIAVWASYMYPTFTRRCDRASGRRLWMFRWLFFRFRPERHYYGLLYLCRNLIICLVPVICRDDQALQIVVMTMTLLLFMFLQLQLQPWRQDITNVVDAALTCGLLLVLMVGAMTTDFTALEKTIEVLGVLIFVSICCLGLVLVASLLHMKLSTLSGKPYQYFICHHKAGTGSFARLLKMYLTGAKGVHKGVFIDSDDLKDLDQLFDYVGNLTDVLIILCSSDLLLRPWCVGELVTAKARHVATAKVIFPTFVEPDADFIENYKGHVPDLSVLMERGIALEDVQAMLRWLPESPQILLPQRINASTVDSLVTRIVARGTGHVDFVGDYSSKTSKNVIVVDTENMEATATAYILSRMLVHHFQEDPDMLPYVLPADGRVAAEVRCVALICTTSAFLAGHVLQSALAAAEFSAHFLPIFAEASFIIPTEDFWDKHWAIVEKAVNDPDRLPDVVEQMFKTIAVVFQPEHYGSTELVLRSKADEVAQRIKRRSLKRLVSRAPSSRTSHASHASDTSNISTVKMNL